MLMKLWLMEELIEVMTENERTQESQRKYLQFFLSL